VAEPANRTEPAVAEVRVPPIDGSLPAPPPTQVVPIA